MDQVLYDLMNWTEVEEIVYSESENPHAILGPHLREEGLLNKHAKQSLEAYISVPSADLPEECLTLDGGLTYAFKYGRETGSQEVSTKAVPFSERNLDPANLERIRNVLPRSYSLIEPGL